MDRVMDRIRVSCGAYVTKGDYIRIVSAIYPADSPPVGATLPVIGIEYNSVRVPWARGSKGYYGKMPECVVKAYSPDDQMDEGL